MELRCVTSVPDESQKGQLQACNLTVRPRGTLWKHSLLTGSLIMSCGMGRATVGVQVSGGITVAAPGILFALTHLRISMLFTNVSSSRCKETNSLEQGRNESKSRDWHPKTAQHGGIVR